MIQDRSNTKLKVVVAKENYSRKVKVTPLQFRSRVAEKYCLLFLKNGFSKIMPILREGP